MLSPETCPHCRSALAMTQQAFETKLPPPECVRNALLLGLVVGARRGPAILESECCPGCKARMDKLAATLFAASAEAPPAAVPTATPATVLATAPIAPAAKEP